MAFAIGAISLCMAMAQMHFTVHELAGGQLSGWPLAVQVACCAALMAFAGWIVLRSEQDWTKPAGLDYASFRKHGWSTSRTVIVALSLMLTATLASKVDVVAMSMFELQLAVLIAVGYASWCATGLALLWSLVCSHGGGGWPLQGAPVPLAPIRPRLSARRALVPA